MGDHNVGHKVQLPANIFASPLKDGPDKDFKKRFFPQTPLTFSLCFYPLNFVC